MAEQWYFARGGRRFGPFSAPQLQELAAQEQLRPQDTVWKEGMKTGVRAAKVRHLFAHVQTLRLPELPSLAPRAAAVTAPAPAAGGYDNLELVPIEENPLAAIRAPAPTSADRRVLGVKGGILVSQEGGVVTFRNKCRRCGRADIHLTTQAIQAGVTSVNYYCPKCRKTQVVEVQAED